MLKSFPVADPVQLYRIGDTEECCVEGWEDDDWSLFSYQLYQRLAAAAPELEETTAFQAAPAIYSIRQEAKDREARPLPAEYVSGSYFHAFGLGAFAGRVINTSERSTVGLTGGDDQLSHLAAGLWLRPGDCRVHILRARTAGHVDWDYASGIFWGDTA
jgi:hypothetical protein